MKIAGWLGAVTRSRQRCSNSNRLLVLQFGGARAPCGTRRAGDADGRGLAEELRLTLPEQPWHTQRDRLVEFGSVLGLIAGSLGKLGATSAC
jgi:3-carboxy-cis,cis-muconate cycloisomerase